MHPGISALIAQQGGLITSRQAVARGLDPREIRLLVRTGVWVRVRRGVYVAADVWHSADEFVGKPLLRVRAAHLVLEAGHHFSHDSSALVHQLWLHDPRESLVHTTRPRVLGRRQEAGIKHHKAVFRPTQATVMAGLPVLDRARTALDIAREHGLVPGIAAISSARRLGTTMAELERALEQMWCWPGSVVMRQALELSSPRLESYAEASALHFLLELGIGTPVPQFELSDGDRYAACDFRIGRHIVEVDGFRKYAATDEEATTTLWAEKKRQDFVTGFKLGVSRLTWHDQHAGRAAAQRRVRREYDDTCRRFGTDVSDLAPYIVHRRYPPAS